MTLLGAESFLRIHNEITRGISGGGPKKNPSGRGHGQGMPGHVFKRIASKFVTFVTPTSSRVLPAFFFPLSIYLLYNVHTWYHMQVPYKLP